MGTRREGRPSTHPLLINRTEAGTMAEDRRPTTDIAPPHPSLVHSVRMLEKRPDPATSCHFLAPIWRVSGAAVGSARRGRIMGSDPRCGRPGPPETGWHRCTENCHRGGERLFTMRMGGRRRRRRPKRGFPRHWTGMPGGGRDGHAVTPPTSSLNHARIWESHGPRSRVGAVFLRDARRATGDEMRSSDKGLVLHDSDRLFRRGTVSSGDGALLRRFLEGVQRGRGPEGTLLIFSGPCAV
jgi:hypothetical protein